MFKHKYEQTLAQIRREQQSRKMIEKAPSSLEEQCAAFNSVVDSSAAGWQFSESQLCMPSACLGFGLTHGEGVGKFIAFFFRDELKAKFAASVKASATGDEIDTISKRKKVLEHDVKIATLWRQYESEATEAEIAGASVPRPADEPPAIYLEWNETKRTFNYEKFRLLENRTGERNRAAWETYRTNRDALMMTEMDITQALASNRGALTADRRAQLEEKLQKIKDAKVTLSSQFNEEQSLNRDEAQLLAACNLFLQKRGINTRTVDFLLSA